MNSSLPDHRTTLDHEDQQFRNQEFFRKVRDAANARGGGGGGRGGGRGGRGGDHVRCCFACGLPGHFARDCPTHGHHPRNHVRRVNQPYGDPSKTDVVDVSLVNDKFRTKPTFSESGKPIFDPLSSNNAELIKSLLSKIEQKEKDLELYSQENEGLKSRLIESASEISSARAENEKLIKRMNQLEQQLEESNNSLCSAKENEAKMSSKWFSLTDELQDTINYLNKKVNEVEEANKTAEAETKKMKLEAEQWRKAAKAAMAVLAGGAEICSKTPELEALVLYYSNRASKRMSMGKMRKAIDDCRMAARLDPNFLKVCLTAGNCHLVLGEVDDALYNFKKCLDSGMVCLDRRLTIEASDGLQCAQKLVSYINQSAGLLEEKTFESATTAMEVITDALSISRYSEKLHEMKGEALFMLRKYEEVIQMCEQTLDFAEKIFATVGVGNEKKPLKLWRWSLMSRSYFHLGRLETALSIIEKQEQLTSNDAKTDLSFITLAATVRELLRCKSAGNEAYQGGRHKEALEHYSNALLKSIQSRPFTAVCLCNRAAAHQALGQVIDAIADCNLAIALNATYIKAIFRRANLHEKIRDYEQAALDFRRLISLLENQCEETKLNGGSIRDLRLARQRLSSIEINTKRGLPLNLYLILGLKGSDSGSDIKKAYHKAALRHHPDKAGKFLARSESGDDGQVWKEIVTTVHMDADRLFKMIGQAYAVLSDSNKKFRYDLEDSDDD